MADYASHRRSLAPLPALGSLYLLSLSMLHSGRLRKALSGGHTGSYLLATKIQPEDYFVEVQDFGSCLDPLSQDGLCWF